MRTVERVLVKYSIAFAGVARWMITKLGAQIGYDG